MRIFWLKPIWCVAQVTELRIIKLCDVLLVVVPRIITRDLWGRKRKRRTANTIYFRGKNHFDWSEKCTDIHLTRAITAHIYSALKNVVQHRWLQLLFAFDRSAAVTIQPRTAHLSNNSIYFVWLTIDILERTQKRLFRFSHHVSAKSFGYHSIASTDRKLQRNFDIVNRIHNQSTHHEHECIILYTCRRFNHNTYAWFLCIHAALLKGAGKNAAPATEATYIEHFFRARMALPFLFWQQQQLQQLLLQWKIAM